KRATEDLAVAQEKLNDLTNGYPADSAEAKAATDALTQANADLASKEQAVVSAQDGVQSANDGVVTAVEGARNAREAYNKVLDDGIDKERSLKEAVQSAV